MLWIKLTFAFWKIDCKFEFRENGCTIASQQIILCETLIVIKFVKALQKKEWKQMFYCLGSATF